MVKENEVNMKGTKKCDRHRRDSKKWYKFDINGKAKWDKYDRNGKKIG